MVHGGVLHALYNHVVGRPCSGSLLNACLGAVAVDGDAWTLLRWNEGGHLLEAGSGADAAGFGGGSGEA